MSRKDWIGIAYVSTWVIIWGTFGSLIDYPLLQKSIYNAGSIGQLTTFSLTAIICIIMAIIIFPKVRDRLTK